MQPLLTGVCPSMPTAWSRHSFKPWKRRLQINENRHKAFDVRSAIVISISRVLTAWRYDVTSTISQNSITHALRSIFFSATVSSKTKQLINNRPTPIFNCISPELKVQVTFSKLICPLSVFVVVANLFLQFIHILLQLQNHWPISTKLGANQRILSLGKEG